MNQSFSTGLSRLAYKLPSTCLSLEELAKNKSLTSSPEILRDFGFSKCFVSESHQEIVDLIIKSAQSILSFPNQETNNKDIEAVIFYSALSHNEEYAKNKSVLELFTYTSARVQYELGLKDIPCYTLSEKGCSGLFSAFELADKLLKNSSKKYVLCLSADRLPTHNNREIIYNIMSDAAAAVLIEKNGGKNKILTFHEQSNLSYWNTAQLENEILAMYFPMAERSIRASLDKLGLTMNEIAWFIPHNVSLRSWSILAKLLNLPTEKIWTKNIERIGHTVSCDHVINLSDMEKADLLKKGDKLLLFTFGFGAHWSTLIIEH
jgi:3-oxoacyl-[acyl-carrier-protein] synthase-3